VGVGLEGGDGVLEGGDLVRGQGLLFVMVSIEKGDLAGSNVNHDCMPFVVGLEVINVRLQHINLLLILDLAGLELSL